METIKLRVKAKDLRGSVGPCSITDNTKSLNFRFKMIDDDKAEIGAKKVKQGSFYYRLFGGFTMELEKV